MASGKRVKTIHKTTAGGKVSLTIVAKRAYRAALQQSGSLKVRIHVTYTPDSGFPRTESKQITLREG